MPQNQIQRIAPVFNHQEASKGFLPKSDALGILKEEKLKYSNKKGILKSNSIPFLWKIYLNRDDQKVFN